MYKINNIIYNMINMIFILIIGNGMYRYMNNNNIKEHMDMSLFDTGTGNFNTSSSLHDSILQKTTKNKLEELELNLLQTKFSKLLNWLKIRDSKVVYDPLSPPEQRIEALQYLDITDPDTRFNVRTRGEPDDYNMVGLLYDPSNKNSRYQLYGRRTYPGSPEWEYYIRGKDNGGLDYKIPLNNKQEIYDGSSINVDIDNTSYTAKIYNYDQPRYIPNVL